MGKSVMSKLTRICVIDGQGGGMGSLIIKRIKEEFLERVEMIALGTNAIATANMMKANANKGASGENAVIWNAAQADVIIGPLSIVMAQGMLGEVTPAMAQAVSSSPARKFLLPHNQENTRIAGVNNEPLPHLVDYIVKIYLKEIVENVRS
jgi:hypothetical protein